MCRRMRHLKPREIQGCQLALDASIATSLYDATSGGSLVAADGAVARWEDQSGNGYNVTQATAGSRPARRVASMNGSDSLQFDGGDYLAQSAASQSKFIHVAAGSTVVFVAHAGAGSNPNAAYGFFGNNGAGSSAVGANSFYDDRVAVPRNNNFVSESAANGYVARALQDDTMTPNIPTSAYIVFDSANATTSARIKQRVNGSAEFGSATGGATASSSDPVYAMQVGAVGNNVLPMTGYISSLAGWSRVLNTSVRLRMHNAGMRKWRING